MLLLLFTALLPLLLLQAHTYYDRFQVERTDALDDNLEVARATAAALEAYVRDVLRQEQALSSALTFPHNLSVDDMNRLLANSTQEYESIRHFSNVDEEGQVIASSLPALIGTSVRGNNYFSQLLGGRDWVVSDLFASSLQGVPAFAIARAERDDQGRLLGAVIATVDAQQFGRNVLPIQRSGQASIAVFDTQGFMVYRYPEMELSWDQRGSLANRSMLLRTRAGEEATGVAASTLDGRQRLVGTVPIPFVGWTTSATQPEAETTEAILRGLFRDAGLFMLVTLLASIAAMVVGRAFTAPLSRLERGASALGRGEPGHPVQIGGPVELSRLADSFNRMSEELQRRQEQEKRYTLELQQANNLLRETNGQLTLATARSQELAAEAQHQAAKLEAVLSSTAASVLICGPEGEITYMNPAAEQMLSYSTEQLRMTMAERVRSLRIESPEGELLAEGESPVGLALDGNVVRDMVLIIHPQDRTIWVSDSAAPIRAADGKVIGAVVVLTDVTRLHELQERTEEYLQIVSHDLRAPLSVVYGRACMLRRKLENSRQDPGALLRDTEGIISASLRMNAMIQDLVDSARLESGQLKPNRQPVELGSLLSDLLERSAVFLDVSRVRLEIPNGLPPVNADPNRLERILTNLLSNALKYSEPGTEVTVRLERADAEVVTSVSDRGPGIPPEDVPLLFRRYHRTSQARARREGLGLGLYITKGLVEAQDGRIWVESELGRGSSFSFSLPACPDGTPLLRG